MILLLALLVIIVAAIVVAVLLSRRVRRADRQGSIAEQRTGAAPGQGGRSTGAH